VREVQIDAAPLERLAPLLGAVRAEKLQAYAGLARTLLADRVVWNVNATASGGGVAELLTTLLAYGRGAGVDTRWLVIEGNPRFFRITKRLHNRLHGSPGDGGPVGAAERAEYESVLAGNLEAMRARVRPGDIVLLHDPQTAGMVAPLRGAGAHVVWRCHVGSDTHTELTDEGWQFLRPYVEEADATIFSRVAFGPRWLDRSRSLVIPPSLDPFSTKNADLTPADVDTALTSAGLLTKDGRRGRSTFTRRDGTTGTLRSHHTLVVAGEAIPRKARLVIQISRWDRLKDMAGVLTAFVSSLPRLPEDVHLALVGPDVLGVSDDPEGAEILFECVDLWKSLTAEAQRRVHLVSLPMDDVDENAHLVNALQRHASVAVQKSLVEGFGLTVTEPMWKARPVVASAVGGIQDQIVDGESGLLLSDPADLDAFADLLVEVLGDDALGERLGRAARERVRDRFLGDRHLIQYVDLFRDLLAAEGSR
jgi:trehalose synthase